MKKFLIALLLSLSCACTVVAAAGCKDDESSSTPDNTATDTDSSDSSSDDTVSHALHFTQDGTFDYIMETVDGTAYESLDGVKVKEGSSVSFNVELGAFYTGYPIVLVNGSSVAMDANGLYTFTVEGETTVKVNGIEKDVSDMQGDGSFSNAFVVTRPIDLLYIAEQVNKGVSSYVNGSYVLANDIDCKGAELEIIGDLSTENSYFSGSFSSNDNPETPATERYTISNFTISSDYSNYVGLFGAVYVNPAVTSSGLFYGISLEDFTINASLEKPVDPSSKTIACGSLIAYGVGVRLYMCDSTNGTINVYADKDYFSYVGGLLGFQQSLYNEDYGSFPAEVAYSAVDVDVNVLQGSVLYAGGVSGYLITNYALTPILIHNAYSTGNISGAFRAGGIAGYLGQYGSVSNCYATGEVSANVSTMTLDTTPESSYEYLHAYAGGLVGFADNDTIVNDSFYVGETKATTKSGDQNVYTHTAPLVAGGYEAGAVYATSQKYIVLDCLKNEEVNTAKISELKAALSWNDADWIFSNNSYPVINYDPIEETFGTTLTIRYVTKATDGNGDPVAIKVNEKTETTLNYFDSAEGLYYPLADAFALGSLSYYLTADDGKFLSYGYYLDEACTLKAPLAYLPTKTFGLYVGFADPDAILGEYTAVLADGTKPVTITLTADGKATYTDGSTTRETNFLYDGETLVLESARLARYYDGAIVTTDDSEDANFDIDRYQLYDFKGTVANGTLSLYDGVYFTESDPLVAKKALFLGEFYGEDGAHYAFCGESGVKELDDAERTFTYTVNGDEITLTFADNTTATLNRSELSEYDIFKGTWTKALAINKTYAFDGKGGWTAKASVNGITETASGTYELASDGKTATLDNGYVVTIGTTGHLEIAGGGKTQIYYADGDAFTGKWISDRSKSIVLTLNGIAENGVGTANAVYSSGYTYALTYEASETDDYYVLYTDGAVFGYFTLTYANRTYYLGAVLYNPLDPNENYTSYALQPVDEYDGEWIGNNEKFNTLSFEGFGLIDKNGSTLTVTDLSSGTETEVGIEYYLNDGFTLSGFFLYGDEIYTLSYDEDLKVVTITSESNVTTELQRKDRFAGYTFVDEAGDKYVFDGKGALDNGGKLTINDATAYAYKKVSETEFAVYEGTYSESATAIGSITVATENGTEKYYKLTGIGEEKALYIQNTLMGDWAIGGEYAMVEIGATTLDGKILSKFMKTENFGGYASEMTYVNPTTLKAYYKAGNAPYTYYLFIQSNDELLFSESSNLYSTDWKAMSRVDDLFGTWTDKDGKTTLSFDGVQSPYAYGTAKQVSTKYGNTPTETAYYYTIKDGGILLWTQNLASIRYYKIEIFNDTTTGSLTNGSRSLNRTEVDSLYLSQATDKDGVVYTFDGGNVNGGAGTLTAVKTVDGNEETVAVYAYKVTSYNGDSTATIALTDKATNETYLATLDYSDASDMKIELIEDNEQAA
ncbi:MAG: hypothetical protein IJX91_05835 [Clostridia bacterium]|nr:hypothetical protein [Clostridia bacterium]